MHTHASAAGNTINIVFAHPSMNGSNDPRLILCNQRALGLKWLRKSCGCLPTQFHTAQPHALTPSGIHHQAVGGGASALGCIYQPETRIRTKTRLSDHIVPRLHSCAFGCSRPTVGANCSVVQDNLSIKYIPDTPWDLPTLGWFAGSM